MVDKKREVKTHHGSSWSAVSSEPGQGAGPTGSLGSHHGIQQLPASQAQASFITTMSSSSDTSPPIPLAPMLPQLEQALASRPALTLLHDWVMGRVEEPVFKRRLQETGLDSREDLVPEILTLGTLMGGAFMDDEVREGFLRRLVPLHTDGDDVEQQQGRQLRALAVVLDAPQLYARHSDALVDAVLDGVVDRALYPTLLLVAYEVLGDHDMPDERYVAFVNKILDRASMWPENSESFEWLKDAMLSLASPQLPPKRLHLLMDVLWNPADGSPKRIGASAWVEQVGRSLAGTPQMTVLQAWVVSKFTRRARVEDEFPLKKLVYGHAGRVRADDDQRSVLLAEAAKFSMTCLLAAAQAGVSPRSSQELPLGVLMALKRCRLDEGSRSIVLEAVKGALPGLPPLHRVALVIGVGAMLAHLGNGAGRQMLCDALCGPSSASPGKADTKGTLELDEGPDLRDLVDLALRALEDPFELLRADLDDSVRFGSFEFAAVHAWESFWSRDPPSLWNVPKDIPAPMRLRYRLHLPEIPNAGFNVPDFVQVHTELMAAIESDATWHERQAMAGSETKASSSSDKAGHAGAPSIKEVLRFYEAFEEAYGLRLDDEQGRLFPRYQPETARAKANRLRAALQEIVLAMRGSGNKAHPFARDRAIHFSAMLHRLEEMLPSLEAQLDSALAVSPSETGVLSIQFRALARDRILLAEHPDKVMAAVLARVFASGRSEAGLRQIVQALFVDAPDKQTARLMRKGVVDALVKDAALDAQQRAAVRLEAGVTRRSPARGPEM